MVNIIIPIYRGRDTIRGGLDSLVAQTKKMFVVTLVQDCDGEDYSDIVNEYTRRGLHMRLLQTDENVGPGNARQLGIDNCDPCDYVMFMDADDALCPRAVEVLYREAKRQGAEVVSSKFICEQAHNPGYIMDTDKITWMHGKIYNVHALRQYDIRFLPNIRYNEDAYFNLVVYNCFKKKYFVDEVTYLWRDNKNSLTRETGETDFNVRSLPMYFEGQIKALHKIEEINQKEINYVTILKILISIYNLYFKHSITTKDFNRLVLIFGEFKPYVKRLIPHINEVKFIQVINQNLKPFIYDKENKNFYTIPFDKWVRDFVGVDLFG